MKKTNPFLPYVSLEAILAYNISKPETKTGSAIVDAVVEAMYEVGPRHTTKIAAYLQLPPAQLSHTLKTVTGLTLQELKTHWALQRARQLADEHPEWGTDKVAKALGYGGRSTLWYAADTKEKARARKKKRMEVDARWRATFEESRAMLQALNEKYNGQG